MKRRAFLAATAAGTFLVRRAGAAEPAPAAAGASKKKTIQDAIDLLVGAVPDGPPKDTVDTVKIGDASQELRGVVVTAVATHEVIRRAGDLKANLVITHEPTFYNHLDETEWLSSDPVFVAKRKLAEDRKIVVFRFHDGWHRLSGDSVQSAIVKQLGWDRYVDAKEPGVCAIPPMLLRDLVLRVKDNLDIRTVRTIGDADFVVNRVFVAPGAWNGKDLMPMVERHKVDAVVTGEVREWEMSEYIRDANAQGKPRALVVTGHVMGEEGAMKALVDWLAPKLPGVPVVHIPAGDPFRFS